jgi:transcriptional regulator with XRE-family HTH domain
MDRIGIDDAFRSKDITPDDLVLKLNEPPHYVFATCPSHPRPEPHESLTGFLTRIGSENEMRSLAEMRSTLLSRTTSRHAYIPTDFPLPSWTVLRTGLALSEAQVLATTFYYLGHKFGRVRNTSSLTRFLRGSISGTVRYCPACLASKAIRPLQWRFLSLAGCCIHKARLLDQCGHCNTAIPLFTPPYSVQYCPTCGQDLAACPPVPLPHDEWEATRARENDLLQLLSHQPWEDEVTCRPHLVGLMLQRSRREQGLSRQDVADRMGLRERDVGLMERLNSNLGTPFSRLHAYATQILGLSLYEVVRQTCNWNDLAADARLAIQELRSKGESVSSAKICRLLEIDHTSLRSYPQLRAIIKAAIEKPDYERDEAALRQAFAYLYEHDIPVTRQRLSVISGIPYWRLDSIPRLVAVRAELARQKAAELRTEERELMERLVATIAECHTQGQPVSEQILQKACHMSWYDLLPYRHVRAKVEEWIPTPDMQSAWGQARYQEAQLVERLRNEIDVMKSQGVRVTKKELVSRVGFPPRLERRWPAVHDVFGEIAYEQQQDRTQQMAQRDEQLASQVRSIMQELRVNGQEPTIEELCRQTSKQLAGLRRYPLVQSLLQELRDNKSQPLRQQEAFTDAEVLELTRNAITALQARGESLTLYSIAAEVGIPLPGLKMYPSVNIFLTQMRHDYRRWNDKRQLPDVWDANDPVFMQGLRAVAQLREEGIPVTAQSVALRVRKGVSTLRRRPLLWQAIQEQQQTEKEQREEQVFLKVQKAVEDLRQKSEEISLPAVSRATGYYPQFLRSRPHIQANVAMNQPQVQADNGKVNRRLRSR